MPVPELRICECSTLTSSGAPSPAAVSSCRSPCPRSDLAGVTHAQVVFPQYYDPIQKYGPEECISALQSSIKTIDTILDLPEPAPTILKGLFGLEGLKSHADFADVLSSPLGEIVNDCSATD